MEKKEKQVEEKMAVVLLEVLYHNRLVNKETYDAVKAVIAIKDDRKIA